MASPACTSNEEQITQNPEISRGHIVIQEPEAGDRVDKSNTMVHVWVALSNLPVDVIDGIGKKLMEKLDNIGISTVGQLSIAQVKLVAQELRINESLARDFIDMATFISNLVVIGLEDDVAELLMNLPAVQMENPVNLQEIIQD